MNTSNPQKYAALDIFWIFLRLGLTSFGGPVAHLGYFREEFVHRRQWFSEQSYADLIALCQFLPGPASSQVGLAIGLSRGGYAGAFAAWAGFTLPSAFILIGAAIGIGYYGDVLPSGVLHGLKIVAVAVVAQAVWGMANSLCKGTTRITIMAIAACTVLAVPTVTGQIATIIVAGIAGLLLCKPNATADNTKHELPLRLKRSTGTMWLCIFFALLVGLPLLAGIGNSHSLDTLSAYYQSGSLVFGGGHVVLPLLQAETVNTGWVSEDMFLAGYGLAQAVPGPLFTFAAFLGAASEHAPTAILGGMLALIAIFIPSFLLVAGALPFWESLRKHPKMQAALAGVNAAVVGLLLAALYNPVWTSAIFSAKDFAVALITLIALMFWKCPPWLAVIACGVAGGLML